MHEFCFKGIPQYFGPLDINVDISILAGHSLLVTERENVQKKAGHYVLKKANSVGYRTSNRLFSSASAEESLEVNETAKVTKQTKQRLWSLQLFGIKVCDFFSLFNFALTHLLTFIESPSKSIVWTPQHIHKEWRSKIEVFLPLRGRIFRGGASSLTRVSIIVARFCECMWY